MALGDSAYEMRLRAAYNRNEAVYVQTISDLQVALSDAQDEVKKWKLGLCLEQSSANALAACVDALKAAHPDSPLLTLTGRTLKDGRPETVLQGTFFAPTFVKCLAERDASKHVHILNYCPEDYPELREREKPIMEPASEPEPVRQQGLLKRVFGR